MTGLVLMWCLSQSPSAPPAGPLAVVVSSKRPGAEGVAASVAIRVHAALVREGFATALDDISTEKMVKAAGFSDARNCQGGANCLVKLALLLGPHAVVVGVDVGKVGTQLALRLEAVSAESGASLLITDVAAPAASWGDQAALPITLFARHVVAAVTAAPRLAEPAKVEPGRPSPPPPAVTAAPAPGAFGAPPAAPPSDAPLAARLTPPPVSPQVENTSRPAESAFKWSLGAGAVVLAGVSVGLLASGLATRSELTARPTTTPDGMSATRYTAREVDALAASSNSQLTVSLVTAVVAAALASASIYLFAE